MAEAARQRRHLVTYGACHNHVILADLLGEAEVGIHQKGVQSEGGAVDGGSIM